MTLMHCGPGRTRKPRPLRVSVSVLVRARVQVLGLGLGLGLVSVGGAPGWRSLDREGALQLGGLCRVCGTAGAGGEAGAQPNWAQAFKELLA